jgi:hypothetical protein
MTGGGMRFLVAVAVVLAAAGGAAAALASPAAASSAPAWTKLTDPFPAGVTLRSVATFGPSGVALLGSSRSIAISQDGGTTWKLHMTSGGRALQALAFADANDGFAVGPAGTMLESTDGGATWASDPSTSLGTFSAVAASATLICALGATSITATTAPAAPSWTIEQPLTTSLSSIVCDAAGFAAAAGAGGTIMTRSAATSPATWTTRTSLPANDNVVALALAPMPVWGNGTPDLFAVSASDVQGSDDQGASFTALPTRPASVSGSSQLSAACLGGPHPRLLVGGQAGLLECYELGSGTWHVARGPLAGDIVACAAGPGSVAYAVSAAGIERTLSYGDPASTLTATPATVTTGAKVHFAISSSILADGTLILDRRPAGGSWQQMVSHSWSSSLPNFPAVNDSPQRTTQYRLRFVYAHRTAMTSRAVTVSVRPTIVVNQSSLHLRKGAAYRLTGQVLPAENGALVTVWTNRGGKWHRCATGGRVRLSSRSTFKTRLFGTPNSESYMLQVRMAADRLHLAAVSSLVRVAIR